MNSAYLNHTAESEGDTFPEELRYAPKKDGKWILESKAHAHHPRPPSDTGMPCKSPCIASPGSLCLYTGNLRGLTACSSGPLIFKQCPTSSHLEFSLKDAWGSIANGSCMCQLQACSTRYPAVMVTSSDNPFTRRHRGKVCVSTCLVK